MLLSVLIPTVSSRSDDLYALVASLEEETAGLPVEILWFGDNRKRTLGKKREALVAAATGYYVMHLDDDDGLAQGFFKRILPELEIDRSVDVIAFNSVARINGGNPFTVRTSVAFENEHAKCVDGVWYDIKRKPWHWCIWRTELARAVKYPDVTYGEDWAIIEQMLPLVKHEVRIDEALHIYVHNDDNVTYTSSTQ